MTDAQAVSAAVARLYDTYPFPPEPLLDEAPPGYNWRWYWPAAYSFCTGRLPATKAARILDAGCGTGVGTEYLAHLNPEASITAIDLSAGALQVAQERCQRSGVGDRVTFRHLDLCQADALAQDFDLINCVGVLHHLPDPVRGIQALAKRLAPGGLFHIFVYAAPGRWEIQLMQTAIALLQGERRGDYQDGVQVGRQIFAALPADNRLVKREKERWAMENSRDASFADMYVHPQEIDYTIDTLFDLIGASGLDFLGFSNPQNWQLESLLGRNPELMARAAQLSDRQRYRLIEVLNPEAVTHYEFFLARPPLAQTTWEDDGALRAAIPERNPCMEGWESPMIFNQDYQVVQLSEPEMAVLRACDQNRDRQSVQAILPAAATLETVRQLWAQHLILLTPDSEK